ncbi:AI-2E family transporter [Sphingomonas jatrophae]|uniref:Predicted PurR-regulated permease PerM n=1 Tax=Sphingomonas jatrophae TaxID=1166337 RepID=A0A1I6LEN7_9SPHN|nr:AI-2E family transporter [Sphingomonas jatrophae]SFS01936.1 Predicted PurR-regulated permease PerM [Sphingomonas jatrophae]
MSDRAPARRNEQPGPSDASDPTTVRELKRAAVWIGLATAVLATWYLAQPILLIIGGIVFAAILDGGTRLLGRVLPIGRGWRLLIVTLAGFGFLVWTFYYAGATIGGQFEVLRTTVQTQLDRLLGWARSMGLVQGPAGAQFNAIGKQLMGSLGQLTGFVGSALGAISSLAMILVIGIFLVVEPRLYERGVAWMLPMGKRDAFYETSKRMGRTLRLLMFGRLLGMAVEGVFTGIFAWAVGIPMAALIGIITGLMAFLPNIGAIISGVLIVLVGFSAGFETGIWAIVIYVLVQGIDGYLIVPMVAKRSVDLAPALVLGAQLLFGALFGILGLALADPIVAMIKVLLEERADGADTTDEPAPTRMPLEGV